MSAIALGLFCAFLGVAVAGRGWLQRRRTGDFGLRGLRGPVSRTQRVASGALVIGILGVALVPSLVLAGKLEAPIRLWGWDFIGLGLALVGFAVTAVSQLQMGDSWRIGVDPGERTSLITHGLYGWIRNPIYSGIFLFGIGFILMVPHPWALASAALVFASIELQVRKVEEPYLRELHGGAYENYVARVGRFFPYLGRLPHREHAP